MKARPSIVIAGVVVACATLFGLGETLQYYLRSRMWGNRFDWLPSISENLLSSYILAALTPIAFFTSARFRLGRGALPRMLLVHTLAGLIFAAAAVGLIAGSMVLRHPSLEFGLMAGKLGTFYLLFYFAIYWAIAGALHAAYYYREAQRRQENLVRERLEVLRGKLNPHFLFNTLNAISTMALQRNHEGVAESLGLVGDMLRASLDENLPQEIPLRRELELTDKYLAIQRIRFGERLRIDRSIDPASLDALVPSMFLQPIIENAVVHGAAARPGDGWVRIESRALSGHLSVTVTDSGDGFAPSPRNGIGLRNTKERLQTMYGAEHAVDIGSVEGGGARVAISIPLRR